ncbi:MAG: hypothetical protein ABFR32_11960, partial [Bacteroidota bacterium]
CVNIIDPIDPENPENPEGECDEFEFDCDTDNGGGGTGDDPVDEDCDTGQTKNEDGICVDDCDTSKDDLKKVFPNTFDSILEEIADALNTYAQDFGLDTKEKLQHFIAQAGHESTNFTRFTELTGWKVSSLSRQWSQHFNPVNDHDKDPNKLNPNDYANSGGVYVDAEKLYNYVYMDENRSDRDKLGNTQEGDGYKYRGRGIWMLTGRDNYQKFNTFYQNNYDAQVDIVSNPDLVSGDNKIAIISALWYFENRLNIEIDSNTSVEDVTLKVNGGTNGLTDRENKFEEAKTNIDCI